MKAHLDWENMFPSIDESIEWKGINIKNMSSQNLRKALTEYVHLLKRERGLRIQAEEEEEVREQDWKHTRWGY